MSIVERLSSRSKPDPDLLATALRYAGRGYSIIAVKGKIAAGLWKPFQDRPADEPTLRRMFGRKGVTGLAVILGSASGGLACRDFDDARAYQQWATNNAYLATILPTVRTARGYHVYFHGPDGYRDLGNGEYRADAGHYCLLPPSRHPDGALYRWVVPLPGGALPGVDPVEAGLITATEDIKEFPATPATQPPTSTHCMRQWVNTPIAHAIADTLPTGPGKRNRSLFELARRLKAIMPNASARELRPIVRQWFDAALPVIRTKEWGVTWEEFSVAWQRVRYPIRGCWDEIVRTSRSITADTGDYDGAAAALIRLAMALQAHHGSGNAWPLSCKLAGEVAGVSRPRAWAVLKMLQFDGVIELVKEGGPKGSRQAAEYRLVEVEQ
jgi:hypothetical protein